MTNTDVVDWRVWKAATVAADAGIAKAGDQIYVCTKVDASVHGPFSFITPSPISLALEIAIAAARSATESRAALIPTKRPTGEAWLEVPQLDDLYRCFQQSMVAVTFSYQSLEAFSNHLIAEARVARFSIYRRGKTEQWSAEEVERRCSTEEKVGAILPDIAKLKTVKGTALWARLLELKDLRDSTIHLKSLDQYVRGARDNKTLYYRLLSADLLDGPRLAIEIIEHYSDPKSLAWLTKPKAMLTAAS